MGIGAAARAWFGCDARELDPAEAALLAGMLRSPGSLDPARHPEASRARRDEVLARMHELGLARRRSVARRAQPIRPSSTEPRFTPRTRAYFLDALGREARRRFALEELRSRGYILLTTLDPADQSRGGEDGSPKASPTARRAGAEAGLPGRAALARSRVRRHPRVGGRTQLPGQPVRPRRARPAPAGQRVQAGDLRRRVRRRRGDAVDPARGRRR